MATLCKNCAAPVVFDPSTQRVVCRSCGSSWLAEEIEATDKSLQEGQQAMAADELLGLDDSLTNEYFDCYVYTCSSCGGEININGTEVSTQCIFCGSSSVVFSRISKEKAPEFIIPFAITREQALDKIKNSFRRGLFVPKEIKEFKPTAVRGIYVPFWLVNAYHVESDVISSRIKSGKQSITIYSGRAGRTCITNLPIDGSVILSDESSQRLEPFDFSKLTLFDEDYLLGFYANVSDVRNSDLKEVASKRATEAFRNQVFCTVRGNDKKIVFGLNDTVIDQNIHYTMLPVWFVTFNYQGRHNTIMVNGQTGKVVCGVPWSKRAFNLITAGLTALFTVPLAFLFRTLLMPCARPTYSNHGFYICLTIVGGITLYAGAFAVYSRITRQLKLSQSSSIFQFTKKRQG